MLSAAEWRTLAVELDAARGPKSVRVIEPLFATHYTPLLGATLSGETDAAVRGVVDAWRTSFEHSYREAYSALRVTGKRPPMFFDAPDIASRLGRLNGARGVKLLLTDSMRFDLGERVAARLEELVTDRAILVERQVLGGRLQAGMTDAMSKDHRRSLPSSTPHLPLARPAEVCNGCRDVLHEPPPRWQLVHGPVHIEALQQHGPELGEPSLDALETAAALARCEAKCGFQPLLGPGRELDISPVRQIYIVDATRVPSNGANRGFVDQKPCLDFLDRDHAYMRGGNLRCGPDSRGYALPTLPGRAHPNPDAQTRC